MIKTNLMYGFPKNNVSGLNHRHFGIVRILKLEAIILYVMRVRYLRILSVPGVNFKQ
jgi:hypothetical protein